MFGAGLNKVAGDSCWRDLTCMQYHYETQMLPNPISYYLHQMPSFAHMLQVLTSHAFELVVPFFLFMGRRMCILHGALQIAFQVVQILSGNLAFLNWLAIVPSIACFDDATIGFLFPSDKEPIKDQVYPLEPGKDERSPPAVPSVLIEQVERTRQQSWRNRSRLQQEAEVVTRDMHWFLSGETAKRPPEICLQSREQPEELGSRVLVSPTVDPVPVDSRPSSYWTRSSRWDLLGLAQELALQSAARASAWTTQARERRRVSQNQQMNEERSYYQALGVAVSRDQSGFKLRPYVNIAVGILIVYLSIPLLLNRLMSPQVSETIFSPLRIVNTYTTFSRVTKVRTEIILQGTSHPNHDDPSAVWEEYEFKCKPGDLKRSPCFLSPFQYRLDWLMWYAALQTYEQNEWVIHLAGKLLAAGNGTSPLLQFNPFMGKQPPRWIRGEQFIYKFSRIGGKHANEGKWWHRKRIGPYFPPVNVNGLKMFFRDRSWPHPPEP
ncbi:lipase maturation factor 1 isoform X2 [Ambystoma mexicanum]|uniref:lipase maturation factor 1 isoform X2 n=1 Tax=Ambystoma mexicanum TaxID=8296 RepID=UPI0037E92CC0